MRCLNCNNEYEGNFCPKCGQKASTSRIQAKEMLLSTITSIIGGNNRLLITCKALLTRPGHMIREYLMGRRASYYAPVSLLLCLVAVYAILTFAIDGAVSPFDLLRLKLDKDSVNTSSAQEFLLYYQAMTENRVYFALFSVVLNLIPYSIVFRNCRIARTDGSSDSLNIAEHFCILTYQTCFNMLLAFILLPLGAVPGSETWTTRLCLVLPTVYCIVIYRQICSISWPRSIFLNLLSVALTMLYSFLLLLIIIGILYGLDYTR